MAPVEGCQVVRHQQEKLAAVQPHAPAPRRHWTIAGINCSAFRNQASVDEDFLPEGTDFVARRRRDVLHQRHVGGDIMTPDRKSTRLNSSHYCAARIPTSA